MGWGGKKGGEGEGAAIFLLGKLLGFFHQREVSPTRRAAGFHEPLAANPGPHGSVYPGMGEPINCSPELAHGARLSSTLQPRQWGWDNVPGVGRGDHCLGMAAKPSWCVATTQLGCGQGVSIPGAGSEPFCSHHLSGAVLGPHAASLERLRVTRAQGSWSPISATPRAESRSLPEIKGP